jgi:hypothetical protein
MMKDIVFLLWSIASPTLVWFFMQRRHDRLRARNEAAAAELLEAEAKAAGEHLVRVNAEHLVRQHTADLATMTHHSADLRKRAEVAEGIVRGQATHIEALQRSNDTMLAAITDMRRVGFALPLDILSDPTDPEVITTVADDDLQAIKTHPHLAAADDD